MKIPLWLSASIVPAMLGFQSAGAALLYSDTFTGATSASTGVTSVLNWYDRSVNTTIGLLNDTSGINNGNALRLAVPASTTTNRGFVAVLPQALTLANVGDSITLAFSFRLSSGSATPGSAGEGFTFGLYNSNATPVTANDTVESDNDFGYRGDFGSGATSRVAIFKEANTGAGGLGTSTDGSAITVTGGGTPVAINDFLAHTGSIKLTYNSASDLAIELMYDGNVVGTGSSTSQQYLTFNELVFSQGGGNAIVLDNVTVDFVPEPSSAALVALCGMLGLGVRRRK